MSLITRNLLRQSQMQRTRMKHCICYFQKKQQISPYKAFLPTIHTALAHRPMSSGITRGTDLLADSLSFSSQPKIIFDGYAPTGIEVLNVLAPDIHEESSTTNTDTSANESTASKLQSLHMNGSCLAFPHSCYLWKPRTAKEVTFESLEMVLHVDPPIELLFIGCDAVIPPRAMNVMKREFKQRAGIIVEQMTLVRNIQ